MRTLIKEIVQQLDAIAGVELLWKRGIVHRGGPHYRLKGTLNPVSIGEDECLVFGRLIEEFKPANCFIVGNAFGMSSVFIAKMMELHGGKSVVTLDSMSEGDGQRCSTTATKLREGLECRILTNKAGWSPQDVDSAADDATYDLIFIDGNHFHPHVTRDFNEVKRLAHDRSIICWHDYWMAGVRKSVEAAKQQGYSCLTVNTSCEIVFGTRSASVHRRIRSLYGNVAEPRRWRSPLDYLRVLAVLLIVGVAIVRHRIRGARL
jgi:predicted O-methyltransferase YrrM